MKGWDLSPRRVAESQVTLVQLMEITDANLLGLVHGGVVMKLVDTAAGLAAMKHCGGPAVTVAMDEMSFLAPVHVGDTVTVLASVNDAGNTSLEVGVSVESEQVLTGKRTHTSSAYLVFVALDEDGKPRPVPPLVAETEVQRRRQREAKIRRETRMSHRRAIEDHRRDGSKTVSRRPSKEPAKRTAGHRAQDEGDQPPHLRI
jgi:acyl-CoA hydrolase